MQLTSVANINIRFSGVLAYVNPAYPAKSIEAAISKHHQVDVANADQTALKF
jgi:hypothetical protein